MEKKNINKTYHPFQEEAQQPTAQFWGIHLANISQNTTETEIYDIFSKYGEIQKITPTTPSSKDIIFKSPQKSNSLNQMISDLNNKFKITSLDPKQLKAPVAKLNLMGNSNTTPTSNDSNNRNEGIGFEVHCKSITMTTTEQHVLDFIEQNVYSQIKNHVNDLMILPGKSMAIFDLHNERAINELTTIIQKSNLNIKFNGNMLTITRTSGDGSVSETPSPTRLVRKTDNISNSNESTDAKQQSPANKNNDNNNNNGSNSTTTNVVNGVDYLMAFGFDHGLEKTIINTAVTSGSTNTNADDDSKSGEEPKFTSTCFKLPESVKGYVSKQAESLEIPQSALCLMLGVLTTKGPIRIQLYKEYKANVKKAAQNSNQNNNNKVNNNADNAKKSTINNTTNINTNNTTTRFPFTPPNKNKDSVIKKDNITVPKDRTIKKSIGEISKKSASSSAANLFDAKKRSTLNNNAKPFTFAPKKNVGSLNKMASLSASALPGTVPSLKTGKSTGSLSDSKSNNKKSSPLSSAAKAPLIKQNSSPTLMNPPPPRRAFNFPSNNNNNNANVNNNQQTANKQNNNAPASLFANSNLLGRNNISHPSFGLGAANATNQGVMISPRGGISLIHMRPSSLLSPTSAIISPRAHTRNNQSQFGVPPVVVPNTDFMNSPMKNNMGIGMKITTPIANLTPVHIPLMGQHQGQNTGFGSPINYQSITPGSPIHYGGITPIINGFTPTAISPNNNYPFINWAFQNQNNNQNRDTSQDNLYSYNSSNNPYIQKNLLRTQPQPPPPPPQQATQFNMGMLNNQQVNNVQKSNQTSNFFKYPTTTTNLNNILGNNVKDSPTGSNESLQQSVDRITSGRSHYSNTVANNMMGVGVNNVNDVGGMGEHMNMMGGGDDQDDCDDDMSRMENAPTLDELNNMRQIQSVVSQNGTTPVVMITNLNEDFIDCDKLFVLCGVFGDVQRVKISYHKRDTAFVQLANHRQAKHVVTSLNRMQLYGKMIHVNLSRMTRVKLPKDSPNSAMMFPDAKFLTKDYSNCKKHRYSKKGNGGSGIKYSPLSIGQPSHILHIANLPIQSEAEHLQKYLCGQSPRRVGHHGHARGGVNPSKIQSIELIGVNNKLGSCQAFAKCASVDIACQILIDFHGEEFLGREIKISFATRSHMPSDINKTHKTYSYTAKKMGSSISSIPAALANAQQSMSSMNVNGMNNLANMNVNDAISNNANVSNNQNNNNNINNNNNNNNNGSNNNTNNNNNNHNTNTNNPINQSSLSDNAFRNHRQQRNSYLTNYDSVGYQTFVVNNKATNPPDQDKIFVRQHHHSGGRKYHYKLRINK